ncbi:Protein of unknown function [Pyronema omphalodes CBS 100304]|uniref:Uncharacterized protein n=1 Tax=Pyronema omphalodes (strain CBS 100304) TaxID=1076935 RepID=U4L138_PYROM|nr:Protein of unknown function [Pyronema omphalodes CBS 100304]
MTPRVIFQWRNWPPKQQLTPILQYCLCTKWSPQRFSVVTTLSCSGITYTQGIQRSTVLCRLARAPVFKEPPAAGIGSYRALLLKCQDWNTNKYKFNKPNKQGYLLYLKSLHPYAQPKVNGDSYSIHF